MQRDWEQASRAGDVGTLERLTTAGVDVNCRDAHGQTALMIAAIGGHAEAVRWLAGHGADLETAAKYRLTALMLAIVNGRREAALALVDAGASLEARGSGAPGFSGKTALDLARDRGDADLLAAMERRLGAPHDGRS